MNQPLTVSYATIIRRSWKHDDTYLVVPEIQVFEQQGFKEGQRVKVTVELAENIGH